MNEFARWSEVFTSCTDCFGRAIPDIPRFYKDTRNIQGGAEHGSGISKVGNVGAGVA
jgi:hypothetical protein